MPVKAEDGGKDLVLYSENVLLEPQAHKVFRLFAMA
jgi:hypothetical protein